MAMGKRERSINHVYLTEPFKNAVLTSSAQNILSHTGVKALTKGSMHGGTALFTFCPSGSKVFD